MTGAGESTPVMAIARLRSSMDSIGIDGIDARRDLSRRPHPQRHYLNGPALKLIRRRGEGSLWTPVRLVLALVGLASPRAHRCP